MKMRSRRKLHMAALTAVATLSLMATSVIADGAAQDFTLHNATDVTFHELYIGPTTDDAWGENLLKEEAFKPGEETKIVFDPAEKAEDWDLKVVDAAGDSLEWKGLKLTEITDITLHYDRDKGEGTAELKNGE